MAATETIGNGNGISSENSINSSNARIDNMLTVALRKIRFGKSNFATSTDENILTEEKCRRIINLSEVACHDTIDDCWIVLFDRVYDVTDFLDKHPGGHDIILEHAGRDASIAFRGHSKMAIMSLKQYEIGDLPEKERIYRVKGLLRCDDLPQ